MTMHIAATEASGALAAKGVAAEEVRRRLVEARRDDLPVKERLGQTTYPAGDDVLEVAADAYRIFFETNELYRDYFPSVQRLERDLIAATSALFHGEGAVASVTSGGTESILVAIKGARDRAGTTRPGLEGLEIVAPETAHPAFWRGAEYFGLAVRTAPLTADGAVDLDAYAALVGERTALMVGSAPSIMMGMVDPIPEMAGMAADRGIPFHVDACVGGYFLPFAERLGRELPRWDFRVPGVTTISTDLHKFGYAGTKGASMLLSRDAETQRYQRFEYRPPFRDMVWYSTDTMLGSKSGGPIAAAWAAMTYLGEEGYLERTRVGLEMADRLVAHVEASSRLRVVGKPDMTIVPFTGVGIEIFAVAAGLEDRGWLVKRDGWPCDVLRCLLSPGQAPYLDAYLADLDEVVALVAAGEIVDDGREVVY